MEFETARVLAALVGVGYAAYLDYTNNRNIPDWLTYSLVAAGVLANLATLNVGVIFGALAVAFVIALIGYPLYRAGELGGADILIFIAIALLLPTQPKPLLAPAQAMQPIYPFVLPLFLVSGVIFTFYMFLLYAPRVFASIALGEMVGINKLRAASALVIILAYSAILWIVNSILPFAPLLLALVFFVVLASAFFAVFKEHIARAYLVEWVPFKKIDEEDVLALEMMSKRTVARYKLHKLLSAPELQKLKKLKLKKYPIYKNLPALLPHVFVALLLLVLFGDPLSKLYPVI
ncbi:MAG: A24 family peptidase [Candidatus Micrarchaeota archaeon]